MSTDNQGCPASRHDRREFLKAAAAVSGVMTATQTLGADGTPKPPNAAPMPQISLGKYSVSRLIVGCHDIDGGGHVSPLPAKGDARILHAGTGGADASPLRGGGRQRLAVAPARDAAGDLQPPATGRRKDADVRAHQRRREYGGSRPGRGADRGRPPRRSDRPAVQAGKARRRPRPPEANPRCRLARRSLHPHARGGRRRRIERLGRGLLPDVRLRAKPNGGRAAKAARTHPAPCARYF